MHWSAQTTISHSRRSWLIAVVTVLAVGLLQTSGCKKPQVEQEDGPPLPNQSGPGGPPAGGGPNSGPGGPTGGPGPGPGPGTAPNQTAAATPTPAPPVAPKGMSLTDACALFDDYLKQLGVNIEGRECDNHVLGEGWVRVNGYTLPDTSVKPAAGPNRSGHH